jgi:hypothetical protein
VTETYFTGKGSAMAIPIEPSGAPIDRHLQQLADEQKEQEDARTAVWGFIWTLFCFKIATVILIIYAARASGESLWIILTTTWYWMIIPAVAVAGPLAYQIRLRLVRRKRAQLQLAEWAVHDHEIEPRSVTIITAHHPKRDGRGK